MLVWIAGSDESDPATGVVCSRAGDIVTQTKAGYWLWKTFKWLRNIPPVIP